jgi:hypothetical protein
VNTARSPGRGQSAGSLRPPVPPERRLRSKQKHQSNSSRRSPLLAAGGLVSKRRWLSLLGRACTVPAARLASWTSCDGPPGTSTGCSIRDGAVTSLFAGRLVLQTSKSHTRAGLRCPKQTCPRCCTGISSATPRALPCAGSAQGDREPPRRGSMRLVLARRSNPASSRAAAAPPALSLPASDIRSHTNAVAGNAWHQGEGKARGGGSKRPSVRQRQGSAEFGRLFADRSCCATPKARHGRRRRTPRACAEPSLLRPAAPRP